MLGRISADLAPSGEIVANEGMTSATRRPRRGILTHAILNALVGVSLLVWTLPASAQLLINGSGGNGGNGSGYDGDGGNGGNGGNRSHVNDDDQDVPTGASFGVSAFEVRTNGGNGGHGGYGTIIIGGNGGEGGNGGSGANATAVNNARLTAAGIFHHGLAATATGGNGGDGGGSGGLFFADEGDGGHGGNGGNASATASASSVIATTGPISYGIYVNASGGNGGEGGNAVTAGYANAGEGGNGGHAGSASGSNAGSVTTSGDFSYGMLVRSAGGRGGDGNTSTSIFAGTGSNGGAATRGGAATGANSGSIITHGASASGMVVQSIGGAGGDGGGGFSLAFAGGGSATDGNDGGNVTATNTGTITTQGANAVGMLIESIGGGGGNGGGAGSLFVSTGGRGDGGGDGGTVTANIGGEIRTGVDADGGDGAIGVLAQSIGGGGGNGGYAVAVGGPASVAVGGSGATGGAGRNVTANQAGSGVVVSTKGSSATGMLIQSVGGGGGNGGGAIAGGAIASVAIGGSGSRGGNAGEVRYNIGNADVTTNGTDSAGVIVQSIGGGGGNGGFSVGAALGVAVGVGGSGGTGGNAGLVDVTSGGSIETFGARSAGFIAQSIGGGGGNGGFSVGGSLGATVGVGGNGNAGGDAGTVTFRTAGLQEIETHGVESAGLIVQSIGGGGGNGGFAGAFGVAAAVSVGGKATGIGQSGGGSAQAASADFNGVVDTWGHRSAGIIVQSVGGGGGNGGGAFTGSFTVSVGVGAEGAIGGSTGTARYTSNTTTITTRGHDSAGLIVQSVGGGGGNGGFSVNVSAAVAVGVGGNAATGSNGERVDVDINSATIVTGGDRSFGILAQSVGGGGGSGGFTLAGSGAVSVGVGGKGGGGGDGGEVYATVRAGSITTSGEYAHAYIAQSVGGGGGAGGSTIAAGLGVNVGVGGEGNVGGEGRNVTASNGAMLRTDGLFAHGFLVQSVGGGGGSGGFSITAGLGPTVSVAGSGDGGGNGGEVRATNTGDITTLHYGSIGLFAQSVGGGGGDGGFSYGIGTTTAIAIGGGGALGGDGRLVEVTNNANISTWGGLSHGILAQSVGGGGGNGGAANTVSAGFAAVSVSVGGGGGGGGAGGNVTVNHTGDIFVRGGGAKGIFAQSVGGNGGSGGDAFALAAAANIYPYPAGALSVSVGGSGGAGGNAGTVAVTGNGRIGSIPNLAVLGEDGEPINPDNGGGILAQSIGGSGGDGGRSRTYSGSFSPTVSINLGASIGGKGGGGGIGNTVTVNFGLDDPDSEIVTTGNNSHGILAQSIGGGGGNGGDSLAGAGGLGGSVTVNATVTVGGWGGAGNVGGTVIVNNGAVIATGGHNSNAILAQSIGGGGGSGGSSSGTTASMDTGSNVNVNANVAIGGQGGNGNHGGAVTVANSGALDTFGDFSAGILAQSIGGGGGAGGSADAKALNYGSSDGTTINATLAIGGGGGDAGGDRDGDGTSNSDEWAAFGLIGSSDGRKVTVTNSGDIHTRGYGSAGIVAQSIGGGGGLAGAAAAGSEGRNNGGALVSVGAGIGLAGGDAGNGGEVEVTNSALILTRRDDANGITASSVGGGGGIGGAASSGQDAEYAIGGAIGGFGGAAGDGGFVGVTNSATAQIRTLGNRSIGIFAQSIGGGGGAGGGGESSGTAATLTVDLSVGGFAESGGVGGTVTVENAGIITTGTLNEVTGARTGHGSHGILAQSIGGGGGLGGAAGTTSEEAEYQISASLSGSGGKGGEGGDVTVVNLASGRIATAGDNAHGIFAQSVGGGGGAAGAGNSQAEGGEVTVNLQLGGTGAGGAGGGIVRVTNYGEISTLGVLSHGIFAQSIGGGGGASSALTQASDGKTSIGIQLTPADIAGGVVREGADGGDVYVNHLSGTISTSGDGAFGIFAQSVGGSGGFGGSMTSELAGDGAYSLQVGVSGGGGGDGGNVEVRVAGDIHTTGRLAHGVVAQSVGGGGGMAADVSGKADVALGVGGLGGAGGNGRDVYVERTGTIMTENEDSIAIVAQSVGGGGGIGGTSFGRFTTSDNGDGPDELALEMPAGSTGVGGEVTVIQTGEIVTLGIRSHGIVAQAVGGGGGIAGGRNKGAGSAGGIGDANAASATANSQVAVHGAQSYALFGQSATGQGNANAVTLTARSSLFAQGADSVAAYGESTAAGTKGDIVINLEGDYAIGGSGTGVAAMFVGGADNALNNNSLLYAMGHDFDFAYIGDAPTGPVPLNAILETLLDDFSPVSITGTSGNDIVNNQRSATGLGRVIGNIDLGVGANAFNNFENSSMVALDSIDLGGGTFGNRGLFTMNGVGFLNTVPVTLDGVFTQSADGQYVVDIDLTPDTNDLLAMTGNGDFAGLAPINFLSIDRLLDENVIARTSGGTMATTMEARLMRPAIGFNFLTRAEGGDLILYADNPTFEDLINDPQTGVTDPGAVQMAQYFDGLEQVQALYDDPSELARLINMLRGIETYEEFGETMMRLTPHYAVHAFEMTNRQTDIMLDAAGTCIDAPSRFDALGRCAWFTLMPDSSYGRDIGAGASTRSDEYSSFSLGVMGQVNDRWSLGATFGRTEFFSEIGFRDEILSTTTGDGWQFHGLAKYNNGNYFADFSLGGGTGRFKGERDTTVAQFAYTPGETLGGVYLPDALHEGIGNSVTYRQKTAQFGGSARFGYNYQVGNFYLNPQVRFDARWLTASGEEQGSVAAFAFDGSDNYYYSATPGLEFGANLPVADDVSVRLFAKGGVEFSNAEWKMEGQFTAAQGLGAPPLRLTQSVDSPLYRLGAGLELKAAEGVNFTLNYNGAFGKAVEFQSVSANLKVKF